jgi:hypothetical protein
MGSAVFTSKRWMRTEPVANAGLCTTLRAIFGRRRAQILPEDEDDRNKKQKEIHGLLLVEIYV